MKTHLSRKIFLIFFLFTIGFSAAPAQERYVRPVDEGARDASFAAFREKTLAAARRRDAKYILSIVDPNIKNSFGGNDGVKEFKEWWKINSPQSEFWDEFITALNNGGAFYKENGATKNKTFLAPYTFTQFPDDLDAFEYHAIFGQKVNLRSKPQTDAPVVASLSYNIIQVDAENSVKNKNKPDSYSWMSVTTLGGKKGFVQAKFVRSPIDYRAMFEKKNGKWKMTAFIAGD
jgi:hypothetical protein